MTNVTAITLAGGTFERRDPMNGENGKIHVLVYEQDSKTAGLIVRALARYGYEVDVIANGHPETSNGSLDHYQIVIGESGESGSKVLRDTRVRPRPIPFLVLSEHSKASERMKALEQGASDFLTKPFDEEELCARVQTVLWREGSSTNSTLQANDLTMDVGKRVVRRAGKLIDLTRTEFSLLELMLRNKNAVLTRSYIREKIWGSKFEEGTNIVDVYINYLRSSIDREFPPRLIHTVRGKGFMLRAE
jgi:DNA-binding response OmpR family regulator